MFNRFSQASSPATAIGIGVISLAVGALFDLFFFERAPGVSWPIFVAAILGAAWFAVRASGALRDRAAWWIIGPLLFFAAMVGVFTSPLLIALNLLACLALSLMLVGHLAWRSWLKWQLLDYLWLVTLPFTFVPAFFVGLTDLVSAALRIKGDKARPVIKGVLMALPLLILFGILLSSADLVFRKFLQSAFDVSVSPELVQHTVIILGVTSAFIGALTFLARHRPNAEPTLSAMPKPRIGVTEINVMLGLLAAMFLAFMGIQVAYLFGGEQTVAAQGFTYAEYARRGFFELMAVSAFMLLILWASDQAVRMHGADRRFRWVAALLIVLVLGIIASSFLRLTLYEQAYGFTHLRFMSHAFTLWLAAMFLLLGMKILRHQPDALWLRWVYGSVIAFGMAVNLANPDAFIAQQNLNRQAATGAIDLYYFRMLSQDAAPQFVQGFTTTDDIRRGWLANLMQHQLESQSSPRYSSWLSFNWSRYRAERLYAEHRDVLERYKDFGLPETYQMSEAF